MIKFSFFKRRYIVNAKLFIFSYIVSVLSVSVAIILTIGIINYLNGHEVYYKEGFILKTFELMALGGLFAVLYSFIMIFSDKNKAIDFIFEFKNSYNKSSDMQLHDLFKDMDERTLRDIFIEIEKRRTAEGKLLTCEIKSTIITVSGINTKKMEYCISCDFSYLSGNNENVIFNFHTINNGKLKLQYLTYENN